MKDNMNNQQIEALLAVRRFVERNTVSADNGYAIGVEAANRNVITHIDWLLEQVRAGQQIPFGVEVGRVWPFESRAVPAPHSSRLEEQHVYALERAVRQARATAAHLGTPDDPYGGLMHAEDADTLEALLAVLQTNPLQQQIEQARKSVAAWPQWMKDASRVVTLTAQQPAPQPPEESGPLVEGWVVTVAEGHSGFGAYAHMTEYPEEGAVFLCAAPQHPAPQPLTDEQADSLILHCWGQPSEETRALVHGAVSEFCRINGIGEQP